MSILPDSLRRRGPLFVLCFVAILFIFASGSYLARPYSTWGSRLHTSDGTLKAPAEAKQDHIVTKHIARLAPFRLTQCLEGEPHYYAPCLAKKLKNVVRAEELIYPAFQFGPPVFARTRPEDSEKWWATSSILQGRARRLGGRLLYDEQHGQTFVFENVTLAKNMPFDEWSSEACLADSATVTMVRPSTQGPTHGDILLANFADSWSIQHFLDRGAALLAQTRTFPAQHILTGAKEHQTVLDLWASLGFAENQILRKRTDVVASRLIWSCRAPIVHPWLSVQFLAMLPPDLMVPRPLAERKVVLYMSRNNGLPKNDGRRVLNEEPLLARIQDYLKDRGQNEKLLMFEHTDYKDIQALIRFFQANVRAIIAPHGGALANHYWCAKDTLILEMQPITRPALAYYELARMREQQYAVLLLDGAEGNSTDMVADIEGVLDILDQTLGKPVPHLHETTLHYPWQAEELELF